MAEEQTRAVRRIVVAVDGSPQSRAALEWAAVIGSAIGATIDAVIAWEFPSTYGEPAYLDDWRPDLDATRVLEDTVTEVFGADRPEGLNTAVLEGPAREVLLEVSASADMLVVGSQGRGGFTGLLLGSVSAACAEHARCAVLVAHDRPRGADLTETAARRHSER